MLHELFDGWQTPLFTVAKSLALFLTAAVAFRFAQRRTIAEFTPIDWVTAVAVGAIVGRVAAAADTSWLTGAAALLTLLAAHGVTARLRFFGWFRRLVDPPVRVLIRDGAVNRPNLKRAGITRSDVDAILRQHGYQDATDVELALYEAKGSVSVFARRSRTGDRAGPAQPEPGSLR